MDNTTIPTHEMIKNLADFIINGMSHEELIQSVYDDLYSIMLEDTDVFYSNLPKGLEPEDFTNKQYDWVRFLAKFKGESE